MEKKSRARGKGKGEKRLSRAGSAIRFLQTARPDLSRATAASDDTRAFVGWEKYRRRRFARQIYKSAVSILILRYSDIRYASINVTRSPPPERGTNPSRALSNYAF